jgi:hypothetical protein
MARGHNGKTETGNPYDIGRFNSIAYDGNDRPPEFILNSDRKKGGSRTGNSEYTEYRVNSATNETLARLYNTTAVLQTP